MQTQFEKSCGAIATESIMQVVPSSVLHQSKLSCCLNMDVCDNTMWLSQHMFLHHGDVFADPAVDRKITLRKLFGLGAYPGELNHLRRLL